MQNWTPLWRGTKQTSTFAYLHIKIHNELLKNSKIEKYKKMNMTENKTDMSITKIYKYIF